jgi:hypothetical protein
LTPRPKLRPDLVLVEQTYRGEQSFIVKDPESRKYFRFRPVEIGVMQVLDGTRTTAEAAAELLEQGIRVSVAAVEGFAAKLTKMGLCERTLSERSILQMERLRAERRRRLEPSFVKGDLLRLRWSVGDPDALFDRWLPRVRFCFSRTFLMVSVALFAIYVLVLAVKWPEFSRTLVDFYTLNVGLGTLVVFWVTGTLIIVIHELGHGFTCKYFGGQVHEIGAMLIYFEPAFFCNVNDAWTFPDLKARLWVTAAGSWIQLVIASIAAIIWWAATPGTMVSQVAFAAVLIGGFTTVLMNANPLIPLDGYYALRGAQPETTCVWLPELDHQDSSTPHGSSRSSSRRAREKNFSYLRRDRSDLYRSNPSLLRFHSLWLAYPMARRAWTPGLSRRTRHDASGSGARMGSGCSSRAPRALGFLAPKFSGTQARHLRRRSRNSRLPGPLAPDDLGSLSYRAGAFGSPYRT